MINLRREFLNPILAWNMVLAHQHEQKKGVFNLPAETVAVIAGGVAMIVKDQRTVT